MQGILQVESLWEMFIKRVKYNKHLQSLKSKLQKEVILNCKELTKPKESFQVPFGQFNL